MRAFYFLQIDRMMSNTKKNLLWLFLIIALVTSFIQKNPYWGVLYMIFGSIILSTTPFAISQTSNYGFLLMLPATVKDRIMGRFFYGLFLLISAIILGGISSILICIMNHIKLSYMTIIFYLGITAGGFFTLSIQYTIFYLFGEIKSQQVMGIIRMIPGFVLFIIGCSAMDLIQETNSSELMVSGLTWISNHLLVCALCAFLISIFIFIAGIFISVQVEKKRDFT